MSRELDARICKLLGWRNVGYDKIGGEWTGIKRGVGRHVVIPRYSVLECDAALVIDRLAALGWMVTVYTGPYPGHKGPVNRCCVMRHPGDAVLDGMVASIAETRPLAICQAFVEAMERWGDEPKN